jgi:dUTP pyrophosphatase
MARIGKHKIILGLPWCSHHNIQCNWKDWTICSWGMECQEKGHLPVKLAPVDTEYLRVKPTTETPPLPPICTTLESIGYDLHAATMVEIPPHARAVVPTGYCISTPKGTYRRIAPQSGLALKHSIDIAAGVINLDYWGEVKVLMINNRSQTYTAEGTCIAQLILERVERPDVLLLMDNFEETKWQEDRFGLTGMDRQLAEIYEIELGHSTSTTLLPQEQQYQRLHTQIPPEYHDYLNIFDKDLAMSKCPPSHPGYDFKIILQEGTKLPPPHHPYYLSWEELRIIWEWLDGMESTGMISKCTTHCPTAAPVFFMAKKDGTKWPVIDYRRLNDMTTRDSYPLPRIDQIMAQVCSSKFFSKFNMKSGYNQLGIKAGQEWLTTFITPYGIYQCNVMTFRFMNAWYSRDLWMTYFTKSQSWFRT